MSGQDSHPPRAEWQHLPLCSSYPVVQVGDLSVQVVGEGVAFDQVIHWALGFLSNGECEALGAWMQPDSGQMPWPEVFEGLKVRGVEQIRFVASGESVEVQGGLRGVYPRATAVPSFGGLVTRTLLQVAPRHRKAVAGVLAALCAARDGAAARAVIDGIEAGRWGATYPALAERWRPALEQLAPIYALPPRLRRVFFAGDGAVQQSKRRVCRAVARHGPFVDRTTAELFVVNALAGLERALVAPRARAGVSANNGLRYAGAQSRTSAVAVDA